MMRSPLEPGDVFMLLVIALVSGYISIAVLYGLWLSVL